MINSMKVKNFGPLTDVSWSNFGKINIIIGANSSGKTFLLKGLYSAVRTLEEYKRGDDPRSSSEILADKLYWTFQPDKIGDLVSKGADGPLNFCVGIDTREFSYAFGKDTTRQISSIENHVLPRTSNSIFLPAKEVLSIHQIILKSREQDKTFGFDDTYLDLARALRQSPTRGNNYKEFSQSRRSLEEILGGKVEYDDQSTKWTFKRGNYRFPIGVTAEGIKKISILDTLLGNRYLDKNSIVFIDEPESALHPRAISSLMDIISVLAELGVQFIMATHSYFVLKKLFLIAQQKNMSIPVLSFQDGTWASRDLKEKMPDNAIVNESIELYEQEIGLALS